MTSDQIAENAKCSVTEGDRIAAAEIVRYGAPGCGNGNKTVADRIKGRFHDDYAIVQLLARHRENSIREAAGEIERLRAELAKYEDGNECICPNCGIRHGGRNDDDPGF